MSSIARGRRRRSAATRWWFITWRVLLGATCVLLLALAVYLRAPLSNYFFRLPRLTHELSALRAQAAPVQLDDGWGEYRAVIHSHSALSHDSEVPFPTILSAAKAASVDVVFMTDHCIDKKADFSLQWDGLHDEVRFMRGWELHNGLLIWGLASPATLDCGAPLADTAARVEGAGGLTAFGHTEMPRPYDLTAVSAMEIYNIHTDFLDEKLGRILPQLLINTWRWPELAIREIYDRPEAQLKLWDRQNRERRVSGFGANDAHQNLGLRLEYTEQGGLWLRQSSRKSFTDPQRPIGPATRWVLELLFGPLVPGRELVHLDLDPYERSLRYVNTHLLAHDNTAEALMDALRSARCYVAFNLLADARGFVYFAEDGPLRATMGENIAWTPALRLKGEAPLPARWTIVKDGEAIARVESRTLDWPVPAAGNYRVELALLVGDEGWLDWIYANPVRVLSAAN